MFDAKEVKGNDTVVIKMPGVESWSIKELKYTCKHNKVKGYTKMNREELIQEVKSIIEKINVKNAKE